MEAVLCRHLVSSKKVLLKVAAPVFQVFEVYEIQTDKRKQISADELMISRCDCS